MDRGKLLKLLALFSYILAYSGHSFLNYLDIFDRAAVDSFWFICVNLCLCFSFSSLYVYDKGDWVDKMAFFIILNKLGAEFLLDPTAFYWVDYVYCALLFGYIIYELKNKKKNEINKEL